MPLDKPLNLDFTIEESSLPAVGSAKNPQPEQSTSHLADELDTLKKELQAKQKQLDAKNQEISELKIKNRQLMEENSDIQARQKVIEEELGKAEAQIDLIQELLLNEDKSGKSSKHE